MTTKFPFNKLLHGGDYNPEQWLDHPEILKKDIEYFKKANINEVSIGIFSWTTLEPEEGRFNLDWMEDIIDQMYENGISVILSTPSAARPKWMTDKYPEVLRVDENGVRDYYGLRHNFCYTSPVFREKVHTINKMLSERFGSHPAVIAWHLSNEYAGAPHDCYCPLCQDEFRIFLKKKYGSIERLNKAWATTFWSHTYNSFDQIEAPSQRGESALHGLKLEWRRFVTDRYADFIKAETAAIREGGSDRPTTINLMYDFLPLNYYKLAECVDFVSWDSYPEWYSTKEHETALDTALQHDLMRSLKKQPFLLMESCPSSTNWQPVSKLKKPGLLHTGALQAIAHGSDSVQYFQLRQSQGANEKFHGAVIDHYGGDDTRVFKEVSEIGATLKNIEEITGSIVYAPAAILYDTENRWAMYDAQGPRNAGLGHEKAVLKMYSAIRRKGINIDVIDMSQSVEEYKLLVIPMMYMFRDGFADKVRAFVEKGGTAVMTYWSGIVDETDLCFLGGTPGGLMDVFGLRSTEIDGLFDEESNSAYEKATEKSYTCKNLCELVKVSTAEVLMTYQEDFYAGYPALTRNVYGSGAAYYVCADFESAFYNDFFENLLQEMQITGPLSEIPDGIEVTTREKDNTEYVFIQNFNREPVKMTLPEGYEILEGQYDGSIKGMSTIIIKR